MNKHIDNLVASKMKGDWEQHRKSLGLPFQFDKRVLMAADENGCREPVDVILAVRAQDGRVAGTMMAPVGLVFHDEHVEDGGLWDRMARGHVLTTRFLRKNLPDVYGQYEEGLIDICDVMYALAVALEKPTDELTAAVAKLVPVIR